LFLFLLLREPDGRLMSRSKCYKSDDHVSFKVPPCLTEIPRACPFSFMTVLRYFSEKFHGQNENPSKQIFTHVTCATDSSMMKFVFDACREVILQENLKSNGFLY